MTLRELRSLVENADGPDNLWERVEEAMDYEWNDWIVPENADEIAYDNHERDDEDGIQNSTVELQGAGKEAIKALLRSQYPEEYDRLFN